MQIQHSRGVPLRLGSLSTATRPASAAVKLGSHSERYPFTNSIGYEAMARYPGWEAHQQAIANQLRARGSDSKLLLLDPGMAGGMLPFVRQPEANAGNRFILESDTAYRQRVTRSLWTYKADTKVTVLPSLLPQGEDKKGEGEVPRADIVAGLFPLTTRTPEARRDLLKTLHDSTLSSKGEVVFTEPVLSYSLLARGGRTFALLRQSLNVLVDSLRHRRWDNVWLEAHHLVRGLQNRHWQPLRDQELRTLLYQGGFKVTSSQQVFPSATGWVPFRRADEGIFTYRAVRVGAGADGKQNARG